MECPVCYEEQEMGELRCGHKLCDGCRHKWFQTSPTCPVCRTPVVDPEFVWNDCCPPPDPTPIGLTREQELEQRFIALVADLFQYALDRENVSGDPRGWSA